ncbi:CopG family transcriptional regulator [Bdellovibrio sp. HCB290]|uniref:CopG family transcriptional regulator n=1 Tax=Bdellovibrio sp. HCB290 TaxID=3394356 RepID=UPI0039B503F3
MKSKKSENRSVVKSDAPQGKVTRVDDFLPPPEVLFSVDDKVKITIEIEGSTLDFFKDQASKTGSKYQRLMRQVLKQYAKKYSA